jgi:hypothetical protein
MEWGSYIVRISAIAFLTALLPLSPPQRETALAGQVGEADRQTVAQFKKSHQLSDGDVHSWLGATVRISCPWAEGSGAIVSNGRILLTVAHIFFSESGVARGDARRCRVSSVLGSHAVRIDPAAIIHGFSGLVNMEWDDWLVARLVHPIPNVRPYQVSLARPIPERVLMVTKGQEGWKGHSVEETSVSDCHLLERAIPSRSRLLISDCDSGPGASGGALIEFPGTQESMAPRLLGIQSRSFFQGNMAKPCGPPNIQNSCYSQAIAFSDSQMEAISRVALPNQSLTNTTQVTPKDTPKVSPLEIVIIKSVPSSNNAYCNVSYSLKNNSGGTILELTFDLAYFNSQDAVETSVVSRVENVLPRAMIDFRQQPYRPCSALSKVQVLNLRSSTPADIKESFDNGNVAVSLKSKVKRLKVRKN